jgi:Reverse transcriptase (RNA-dependent DNA polymerase)
MDRWVSEGFAEEFSASEARRIGLVVPVFVFNGSKRRVVVHYTTHNEVLASRKFRLETLSDLAPRKTQGDSLIEAEVEDAHYHLRMGRRDREKAHFHIARRFFRTLALNCGLSLAPSLFIKFLRPFIQELRRQGHRIISYLDDISGAHRTGSVDAPASQDDATRAGREIRSMFVELGLWLHSTKTDCLGKHALAVLGVVVNTRRDVYLLYHEKIRKTSLAARLFRLTCNRHERRCTVRDVQQFCGLETP